MNKILVAFGGVVLFSACCSGAAAGAPAQTAIDGRRRLRR